MGFRTIIIFPAACFIGLSNDNRTSTRNSSFGDTYLRYLTYTLFIVFVGTFFETLLTLAICRSEWGTINSFLWRVVEQDDIILLILLYKFRTAL